MDRSSRQKIKKETLVLNDPGGLSQIYTEHSIQKEQNILSSIPSCVSSVHGTFFSVHYMLGHKRRLNLFFSKTDILRLI